MERLSEYPAGCRRPQTASPGRRGWPKSMPKPVASHWELGTGRQFDAETRLQPLRLKLPNTKQRGRPGEATAFTRSWRYPTGSRSQPTRDVSVEPRWMVGAYGLAPEASTASVAGSFAR